MKLTGYEPPVRPDKHPSFYCAYQEPSSNIAALVQQPHHNINAESLSLAYMKDCRAKRSTAQGK